MHIGETFRRRQPVVQQHETGRRERAQHVDTAEAIIALTQMGPKTGDPTFSDDWADDAAQKVLLRCPTGRITGLTALRETMDYPVISGEIVTIKGYCIL